MEICFNGCGSVHHHACDGEAELCPYTVTTGGTFEGEDRDMNF